MDFDALTRAAARAGTRRGALRLLAGGAAAGLAGLVGAGGAGAAAPNCRGVGSACARGAQCCSGICGPDGLCHCATGFVACNGDCVSCGAGQTLNPSTCRCDSSCASGVICGDACVSCQTGYLDTRSCTCIDCGPPCPSGTTFCGSVCCEAGFNCTSGACTPVCSPGTTWCNGSCVSLFNDPDNCGACERICSGNGVSARRCTSGTCDPVCAFGRHSCDGNLANGCETIFDGHSNTSSAPEHLGTFNADADACRLVATRSGVRGRFFRAVAHEESFTPAPLKLRFELDVPSHAPDYDLYLAGGCAAVPGWSSTRPGSDAILVTCEDTFGADDDFTVDIEIRYSGGERSQCAPWTLNVYAGRDCLDPV